MNGEYVGVRELSGFLPHPYGRLYGGRYGEVGQHHGKEKTFLVKLTDTSPLPSDLYMPIPDFKLPTSEWATMKLVMKVWQQLYRGKDVMLGCTGGWGRTGTIMAVVASMSLKDDDDPVEFVRQFYDDHAVETSDQEEYVWDWRDKHPIFTKSMRLLYAPVY